MLNNLINDVFTDLSSKKISNSVNKDIRITREVLVEYLGNLIINNNKSKIIIGDIMSNFNVSRTMVREAIKIIEAKGMLVAKPNSGTYITNPTLWNVLDEDVIRWKANSAKYKDEQIKELLQMRWGLESLIVNLAINNITSQELFQLLNISESMVMNISNMNMLPSLDHKYHTFLSNIAMRSSNMCSKILSIINKSFVLFDVNILCCNSINSAHGILLHNKLYEALNQKNLSAASVIAVEISMLGKETDNNNYSSAIIPRQNLRY